MNASRNPLKTGDPCWRHGQLLGVSGPLDEAAKGHLLLVFGPRTEVAECSGPQPLDSPPPRCHSLGGVLPGLVAVQVPGSNRCFGGGGHQIVHGVDEMGVVRQRLAILEEGADGLGNAQFR